MLNLSIVYIDRQFIYKIDCYALENREFNFTSNLIRIHTEHNIYKKLNTFYIGDNRY